MTPQHQHSSHRPPFERIICAIDGTVESIEAARQGLRISPGTPATLVYVVDTLNAPRRQADYPAWAHTTREAGALVLSAVRDQLTGAGATTAMETAVEEGDIADALRYVTSSEVADVLLTLGSGEEKRLEDTLLTKAGLVPPATGARLVDRVVETVTCSVIVARCAADPTLFPSVVTVGVDGSAPSVYALRVAAAVAEQTGARLSVLTAMGGKGPDMSALRDASPHIPIDRLEPEHPAVALVHAAAENGLVVVGNRGLHGLRALGAVSARVVAGSPVSVLVVRQR